MADKEATVYIVDVGASMNQKHSGREETDFSWSMKYVWDKIASAVSGVMVKASVMKQAANPAYRLPLEEKDAASACWGFGLKVKASG